MTRRQRVIDAILHRETDFVPTNLHAVTPVWNKIQAHYGLADIHETMLFVNNHIVKVGSDFNYDPWSADVGKTALTPSGGPVYTDLDSAGRLHTDEFGCVWDRHGGLPHPVAYPLGHASGNEADLLAALADYRMPDPCHAGRFDEAKLLADRYRGDLFIFGKLGMCLFERAWSIRGMTQLMEDMVERPRFVDALLDRILYEWNLPIIDQQLALGIDGFYFAEDWGSATAPLFSPRMWRRFIKPRLAQMYARARDGGALVGQHSDGAVEVYFPDLIEIGLQVFNPLSTTIMDPEATKARWGGRLAFYGGIDVTELLPFGTPAQVRSEMGRLARIMGAGGGYVLQSSHTMLEDVPIPNIVAYVDSCRAMAGIY